MKTTIALLRDGTIGAPSERTEAVILYRNDPSPLPPNSATVTYMPTAYPPCVELLSNLKKLFIKDLRFKKHHRGTCLLVHSIDEQRRTDTISTIVEDEKKEEAVLQLWFYDKNSPGEEAMVPKGAVLVIKEPYLKWMSEKKFGIRVDHPTDVLFVSDNDDRVTVAYNWKKDPKGHIPLSDWKAMGDTRCQKKQYRLAIECYTRALPNTNTVVDADTTAVAITRCCALIGANQFDLALSNLQPIIAAATTNPNRRDALYLKAKALYGLQRYNECRVLLWPLCQSDPQDKEAAALCKRAIVRTDEQIRGRYNFESMLENSKNNPPNLDAASYSRPVEFRPSPSRGKGLFTTKPVKAGDLLLCEKAFTYAFFNPSNNSHTPVLVDTDNQRVTRGTTKDLLAQTLHKLHRQPSLLPIITDLHHTPYTPPTSPPADDRTPIIDAFLIKKIIDLNAICCPRSTQSLQIPLNFRRLPDLDYHYPSCGIWPIASRINHSCNANARRSFVSDILMVRATRDIDADTEVTMQYRPPGARNYAERQTRLSRWGFTCDCAICEEEKGVGPPTLVQRNGFAEKLAKYVEDCRKREIRIENGVVRTYLSAMENTYARPATEVPRLVVWYAIMKVLAEGTPISIEISELIDSGQKIMLDLYGMRSLGFVLEGGQLDGSDNRGLVLRQWGLMLDGV